jgi:patatin-related protein
MTNVGESSVSTPESSPTANSAPPPGVRKAPASTPLDKTTNISNKCEYQPEREIRFAVVMYGGVSLAIYINGVAQELLNMVRATAPAPDGSGLLLDENDPATRGELSGTAAVYRRLGQYLGDREKLCGELPTLTDDPIKTRFIVDVISGTSAGGINGVFLAKAIVRNQKMDGLKQLWLREGDLGKLLNDSFSVSDLAGFSVREPQQSLLNSQRMYRKLLEALDEMDESKNATEREKNEANVSPLVRELDLFITTTDIEGIPLPIKLADDVVYERRYKNVFHFRYATKDATGSTRDDFIKSNDPFLAFAARCTSSFPFAFEAMCLADIRDVLARYPAYKDTEHLLDEPGWDKFFSEYLCLGLYDLDKEARQARDQPGRARSRPWRRFRPRSGSCAPHFNPARSAMGVISTTNRSRTPRAC